MDLRVCLCWFYISGQGDMDRAVRRFRRQHAREKISIQRRKASRHTHIEYIHRYIQTQNTRSHAQAYLKDLHGDFICRRYYSSSLHVRENEKDSSPSKERDRNERYKSHCHLLSSRLQVPSLLLSAHTLEPLLNRALHLPTYTHVNSLLFSSSQPNSLSYLFFFSSLSSSSFVLFFVS